MSIICGIAAIRGLCISSYSPPLYVKTSFLPFSSDTNQLVCLFSLSPPPWTLVSTVTLNAPNRERITAHFFFIAQLHIFSRARCDDFEPSAAPRARKSLSLSFSLPLSFSLSLFFARLFARSHILALAYSGGQRGGTSRFHLPRGCAKRRLSRRP